MLQDPTVQAAMVAGVCGLFIHLINKIDKRLERFFGQRNFQKSALGIMLQVQKIVSDMNKKIESLHDMQDSQSKLIQHLLMFSKQQSQAALQMSKTIENFITNKEFERHRKKERFERHE